jgi:hypothetical protein
MLGWGPNPVEDKSMTKHVADRRAPTDGGRTAAFVGIARRSGDEGSHPAARAALKARAEGTSRRAVAEFLRIARGREA